MEDGLVRCATIGFAEYLECMTCTGIAREFYIWQTSLCAAAGTGIIEHIYCAWIGRAINTDRLRRAVERYLWCTD